MPTKSLVFKTLCVLCVVFMMGSMLSEGALFVFASESQLRRLSVFERNDVREAVDAYCRDLQLNPKNKSIHQNLTAIISRPELSASKRSDILRFEDILRRIDDLSYRADYLSSKRDLLEGALRAQGYDDAQLSKGLTLIKNKALENVFSITQEAARPSGESNDLLVVISRFLLQEKEQLSRRVESLQEQYRWLKALHQPQKTDDALAVDYIPMARDPRSTGVSGGAKQLDRDRAEGGFLPKEPTSAPQTESGRAKAGRQGSLSGLETASGLFSDGRPGTTPTDIAGALQSKVDSLQAQMDQFKNTVSVKDKKIDELSAQLVDISLKLSEAQILLEKKAEVISALNADLADIRQRLALGQKMMQEKDNEMQLLSEASAQDQLRTQHRRRVSDRIIGSQEKRLAQLDALLTQAADQANALNDIIAAKDSRLIGLEADLKSDRDNLARFHQEAKLRADGIVSLEDDLVKQRERYAINQKAVNKRGGQMTALEEGLAEAQKAAGQGRADFQALLSRKESEITELNGILNIYKQSLGDAGKTIEEKNRQLDVAKAELAALNKRISVQESSYSVKDSQIKALKEAILRERAQEDRRNISLRNLVMQKDSEIDRISQRLAMAQKSLDAALLTIQERAAHVGFLESELDGQAKVASETAQAKLPAASRVFEDSKAKVVQPELWNDGFGSSGLSSNADIDELNGILAIYKDKLAEKSGALVKTIGDLAVLEDQLAAVRAELIEFKAAVQGRPTIQRGW